MKEDYQYKVTIGMPVYGVEKYIHKCLTSVLNQTFNGDFEIIVVDDLGPDKSIDIVRDIQASHPKGHLIKILTQPHNMGCWAARNRILDEAQGKYLLLVDSDDYLSEDAVERIQLLAQLRAIDDHNIGWIREQFEAKKATKCLAFLDEHYSK